MRYYRAQATEIDYPVVADQSPPELTGSSPPHTIRDMQRSEIRDMSLAEALHIALMNSEVIRRYGEFLSPGNMLLRSPNFVPSVYDPAIQESGVLFGGRGVEAALAEFDATLSTSLVWGRNEAIQNNPFFGGGVGGGGTLVQDTARYQAGLQKVFAHGGSVQLNNNINYLWSNTPGVLFNSIYTGNIELLYQQPLLAGAGTQYTRTAGPIVQSFGGITGVSQGVLIARINNDISIADFEESVHSLVMDVETAYWDLYLAYRNFDTAVVARNAAIDTWRLTARQAGEVLIPADEAQARSALYIAQAASESAQSNVYLAETSLRRLLGMPINDGTIIRPVDEPVTAELVPDWYASLTEALGRRVDLRRQKWNIKSLELQLAAAESLTQPRLDFIGGYRVNGFGDDLLDYDGRAINSYAQTLTANNQTGWDLGFQMTWPIGLRSAHAQVRNYELRLAKAQKVLAAQELEVGHELAAAFQELARAFATMHTSYQAYVAAEENVQGLLPRVLTEDNVDVILRAYERRARAELAYYQSVVDYNKALANLQFRKGSILEYNGVTVMEGPWTPEAYYEANRHAQARGHALRARHLYSHPPDFAADGAAGRAVMYTSEEAARQRQNMFTPQADPGAPLYAPPAVDEFESAPPPPPPGPLGATTDRARATPAAWDVPASPTQDPKSSVQRTGQSLLDTWRDSVEPAPVPQSAPAVRRTTGLYDF